jgi:guanylate kinase
MIRNSHRSTRRRGIIFILSAPSGAGKTTLINGLRSIFPEIELSVSWTTRSLRGGEVDGRDYRFVTRRQFDAMRAKGQFAEWAKVHSHRYGTLRGPLERCARRGRDILLDIDVQGAKKIKRLYPGAVAIFLLPPSLRELARRLARRGTEGRETMRRRLANARGEIRRVIEYDYCVINRDVQEAVAVLRSIVEAERSRTSRVSRWRMEPLRAPRARVSHEQRSKTQRSG